MRFFIFILILSSILLPACGKKSAPLDSEPSKPTVEISIPVDLEVQGTVQAPLGNHLGRLILRNGATLIVGSTSRTLYIDDVISEGGKIVTREEGATATMGQNGEPSGVLKINILKGTGSLKIIARGQNGGEGFQGESGMPGSPGGKGQDAQYQYRYPLMPFFPQFSEICPHLADKFASQYPPGSEMRQICLVCDFHAEDGHQGGSGGVGGPGLQGYRGSDSGSALVTVLHSKTLSVEVETIPGQGGIGGRGGPGGSGGPGGLPGEDMHGICSANAGAPGPQGGEGIRGQNGEAGRKGISCLERLDVGERLCTST